MRNIVFAALFSLVSASGYAADSDVCSKFIACGEYEGTGSWYDVDNNKLGPAYSEKIIITPMNQTTVNLKVYLYDDELPQEPWADANLVFQPNGKYTVTSVDGHEFGAGFCADMVCTIAFRPVDVTDQNPPFVNSFVNILRFEGNTLKRYNMVSNNTNDTDLKFQRSELTKK